MRKYVLSEAAGIEGWDLVQAEPSALGPYDVRVDLRAWSLNYRDMMITEGTYGGQRLPGLVPLSDGAGEVVEVGSAVTQFKPGDRVASCFFRDWIDGPLTPEKAKSALGGAVDGVLAEEVVLPETSWVRAPNGFSHVEAATLPCAGLTAWHALFDVARLQPGQTVLVQGTGGVSMFALQCAKAAGAKVIVTSSSDEKLAKAFERGADQGINYRANPDWEREAFELTGREGVDVVIEVGGADTLPRSLKALRYGGNVVVIGVLSGVTVQFPVGFLFSRNAHVTGIYVGSRTQFQSMVRGIEASGIHPVIDREFGFDDAKSALQHLKSGQHMGKVAIVR